MINININDFNKHFAHLITLPEEEQHAYYRKHIHKYILDIIHNVLYYFSIKDDNLLKEDVAADLLCHFWYKLDKLKKYDDNYSGAIYRMFKYRLLDIYKWYNRKQARLNGLVELRNEYLYLTRGLEDVEIDLDTDGK